MVEVIDMYVFTEAKALMKAKFGMMLQYFLEDAAEYISVIKKGVGGNDMNSLTTAAHTLKSSAGQIGAIRLSAAAAEIEEMARSGGNCESISALLPGIDAAFAETAAALRTAIPG